MKIEHEYFDTLQEAQDFSNSLDAHDYYGIHEIKEISWCDEFECWAVYFI